MVVTGASREHSPQALELARAHPGELFATAGVHPHHASEYTAECDAEMRELHAHPEVVAVGEFGLDYFRDFSPRPAQRRAFRSEEHTSELQSLMRNSYAVICLKKKKTKYNKSEERTRIIHTHFSNSTTQLCKIRENNTTTDIMKHKKPLSRQNKPE